MKEIVVVSLAADAKIGALIPDAPFWSKPVAPIAAASGQSVPFGRGYQIFGALDRGCRRGVPPPPRPGIGTKSAPSVLDRDGGERTGDIQCGRLCLWPWQRLRWRQVFRRWRTTKASQK